MVSETFGEGEYRTIDKPQSGFISGETFAGKEVQYSLVDGDPIFEGDIILSLVERGEDGQFLPEAVVVTGHRWKDGIIPYEIDAELPDQSRVENAIRHWEEYTIIRFVKRTSDNAEIYPNYVLFKPSNGCSSSVGMRGGKQHINLAPGCALGSTIHEIGHTVGLWHEQSREDRNEWITVHYEHISLEHVHNFNQHITDGDDIGPYDYASIMHYGPTAFSTDGEKTITTKGGEPIGQRIGLSAGDIAAVWHIYHNLIKGERTMSMKFASGSTTPGATNWIRYSADGIYLDIDTSSAGFTTTPKYFTSLGGKSNHWTTQGTTSIYNASKNGFRVYVHQSGITPNFANSNEIQWHINWLAVGQ